jgi:hypothetical protein
MAFVFVCSVAAWACSSMVPVRAGSSTEISHLIDDLASGHFARREAATTKLESLGAPALEALHNAARGSDPEARWRARELVRRIAKRVEAARLLESHSVRISATDVSAMAAVDEFGKATGVKIQVDGDQQPLANRKINLAINAKSFWEALDDLCRQTRLTESSLLQRRHSTNFLDARSGSASEPLRLGRMREDVPGQVGEPVPSSNSIVVTDGPPPALPTFYAGAVRIRAVPVASERPSAGGLHGRQDMILEVALQPRFAWRGVLDVRIERALDAQGNCLKQSLPPVHLAPEAVNLRNAGLIDFNRYPYLTGSALQRIPVQFRGEGHGGNLSEVEGIVTCQIQTPFQPLITVPRILTASGKTVKGADGSALTIVGVARGDDGRLQVRARFDDPNLLLAGMRPAGRGGFVVRANGRPMLQTNGMSPWTNLVLRDRKGRNIPLHAVESTVLPQANGLKQEFVLTYAPRSSQAEEASLIYSGQRLVLVEVPFRLKDVPLS